MHPYFNPVPRPDNSGDERIVMSGEAGTVNRETVVTTLNLVAEKIGTHMQEQGFWEDEDFILGLLAEGVRRVADIKGLTDNARREMFERARVIALRWKDAEKDMLLISELVEAQDAKRKGIVVSDHLPDRTMDEEENVDVAVRLFDKMFRRGMKVGETFVEKLMYNAGRTKKHGKAF